MLAAARSMIDTPTGRCGATERPETQDFQRSGDKRKRDKDKSQKTAKKKTEKKDEEDSQETRLPPWRSEYQDNIGRLGEAILKARIHQKKKQGPAWESAVLWKMIYFRNLQIVKVIFELNHNECMVGIVQL